MDARTTEDITLGADHRGVFLEFSAQVRSQRQRRSKKKTLTLKGWCPTDPEEYAACSNLISSSSSSINAVTESIDQKCEEIEAELTKLGSVFAIDDKPDKPYCDLERQCKPQLDRRAS